LYADCNAFLLKSNHNGQKNADITISNHTHRVRQDDRQYVPLYQVSDEPMDEYNLVYKFFHQVLPPNDHLIDGTRIFRYQASRKQIKVSLYYIIVVAVCCLFVWMLFISIISSSNISIVLYSFFI
jgi:hypothetical protein